jgi:molybdopterin/thiamine biosynthesis adenylyltransferase/rhodanese-related sulfurtransferase
MPLTFDEEHRYSRHLILPGVGVAGQERLRRGRVLLVGAGGLGSPAALYLAAAGVGTLGIADGDTLDVTNLQRQVLHRTADVGRSKAASAVEALAALNPLVSVVPIRERITAANALTVLREYDVIIDGTDNFPTRYLLNDACALLGKPLVFGSVYRFEGQATVFDARTGPCYRCLFPHPPDPARVPSCAEGGVLGVLPGLIGTMQATEALKLLLGLGESLLGRLLLVDARTMRFRELAIEKNPDCPLCGASPTITALIDYQAFCGILPALADDEVMAPAAFITRLAAGNLCLVDLREEWELDAQPPLSGARHLPYPAFTRRMAELNSAEEIVLYCSTGMRSALAARLLRRAGFFRVASLRGGLAALREHYAETGA